MTEPTELDPIEIRTENDSIIEAVRDTADPYIVTDDDATNNRMVWLFHNGELTSIDLTADDPHPRRQAGSRQVHDLASMQALVEQQAGTFGPVVTYADAKSRTVTTVLNDHDHGVAGWRDHSVTYTLELTPAMQSWVRLDRQLLDQVPFAEHIEERMSDVVHPDGADLLEIAQTLTASTSIDFRSGRRLADGRTQLNYVEETDAVGGTDGQLEIPSTFTLRLPVFVGTEPREVTARFRYRITGSKLTLGYVLDNLEQLAEEAFSELVDGFEAELPWLLIRAKA